MSSKEGSSPSIDAADAAGGEAVFSSDGLAPLPVPSVPAATTTASSMEGRHQSDIVTTILDTGESLLSPTEAQQRYATTTSDRIAPELRLYQLQQQAATLERELKESDSGSAEVTQQAAALVARLEQRVMSTWSTTRKTDTDGTTNEIVAQETQTVSSAAPLLEQRLVRLEKALGASTGATPSSSLLQRLDHMESLLRRVDDKSLDDFATRAKVIRSDLEAASKAKNKLMSSSTSSSTKQESQTIAELHQQMQSLEGVSQHLPALSLRLQQLAQLHVQTATFHGRLTSTEQVLQQTQISLKQMEEAVDSVQAGLKKSSDIMEENVKQLEERLK